MPTYEECLDDLKMLHGLEPYNTSTNICWHDNYFGYYIERTYPKDMLAKAKKELGL